MVKKQYRRLFLSLLFLILLVTAFAGCKGDDNNWQVHTTTKISGTAIPTKSKIYSIVFDNTTMTVMDEEEILSDEDIETLTKYTDIWVSANDTRGKNFQEKAAKAFLTEQDIAEIKQNVETHDYDYKVEGTQIFSIAVVDDGVEVAYLTRLTGKNAEENLPEGQYDFIDALKYKKVNNNWHFAGATNLAFGETGSIEIEKDELTGEYTVVTGM